MKRSWQKAPSRGERQHYAHRIEWRWYGRFLPEAWLMTGARIPQEEWWSWDGIDVHLDRLACANPRAVVIMLHGGGGNGRVLMMPGALIHSLGVDVVAPDLPGFGLTRYPKWCDVSYDRWADLVANLGRAEHERTGLPVVLVGMSLGGLLAYGAAARAPEVAGVIATTLADTRTARAFRAVARSPLLGALSYMAMPILPRFLRGLRLPIRWVAPMHLITNDPEFSALFSRDPLGGGSLVTLGFFRSLRLFDVRVEPDEFSSCPILVCHPELDPWTPAELSHDFYRRAGAQPDPLRCAARRLRHVAIGRGDLPPPAGRVLIV